MSVEAKHIAGWVDECRLLLDALEVQAKANASTYEQMVRVEAARDSLVDAVDISHNPAQRAALIAKHVVDGEG